MASINYCNNGKFISTSGDGNCLVVLVEILTISYMESMDMSYLKVQRKKWFCTFWFNYCTLFADCALFDVRIVQVNALLRKVILMWFLLTILATPVMAQRHYVLVFAAVGFWILFSIRHDNDLSLLELIECDCNYSRV